MLTLPEQIAYNRVNDTVISTVKLNGFSLGDALYETCVFFYDGSSEVVGRYTNSQSALENHMRVVDSYSMEV